MSNVLSSPAPIESVKVGDTVIIAGKRATISEVNYLEDAVHLTYPDVAPWGPCNGLIAAVKGTMLKVIAA